MDGVFESLSGAKLNRKTYFWPGLIKKIEAAYKNMVLEQKELKFQGKIIFERLVLSAAFRRVPKLFAEDEACFLYLTKGAFQFRTPAHLLTFQEGDGMLSKCGNYFIENVSLKARDEHQVISAFGAFFYPEMVKQFFQGDLSLDQFRNNFDTTKVSIEPMMLSFIDSVNYLLENPELADENLIVTKLKELLILLSKSEKAQSIHDFVHALFIPYEYQFKEIIHQNQYSNLSLTDLAYLCNMSLATFKRRFSESYGESPARYLQNRKLEKAQALLQNPGSSISEVAFECGFESVSGFDKAFKKFSGQSPTEYRMSRLDK